MRADPPLKQTERVTQTPRQVREQAEAVELRKENKMKFRVIDSRENGQVLDKGHLTVDINEKSKFLRKVNKYNNFLKRFIKGLENKEPSKCLFGKSENRIFRVFEIIFNFSGLGDFRFEAIWIRDIREIGLGIFWSVV